MFLHNRIRFSPHRMGAVVFAVSALALLCPVGALAQSGDDVPGDVATSTESTTLSEAARDGNIGKVKALLAGGIGIDTRFPGKHTALMGAASYGKLEMVRFLLERGADATLRDAEGRTAAMRAKENGHTAIAALLAKGVTPVKENVAVAVPPKNKIGVPTDTTVKPPAPGKDPSDAFLQQLVRNYYRMGVNGTLTAPLRVDVRIDRFVREPKIINKVSVVGARVYRVNSAAPANAPLYPIIVQVTNTEHYRSGASAPETLRWTFDAFDQQAGMVSKGGWVLSSKGPVRSN